MKVRKIKLVENNSDKGNNVRCVIDMTEKEYLSLLDKPTKILKEAIEIDIQDVTRPEFYS